MERALEQPVSKDHPGLEATVIAYLAYKDVDEALEYLPQVRSGATQLSAYRSVGIIYVQNGATEEAISLVQQLPSSIKEDYFQAILVTWTEYDDEALLDSIDQLPTAELKSKAALVLSAYGQRNKSLSNVEKDRIREFLTEEDAEILEEGDLKKILRW